MIGAMAERVSRFVRALVYFLAVLRLLPQHHDEHDELRSLESDDAEFEAKAVAVRAPVVAEVRPPAVIVPGTGRVLINAPTSRSDPPDDNWFMGSPRVLLGG
jgi:hypothetical protein